MKKFSFKHNIDEKKLDKTLKFSIMDSIYKRKYKNFYFKRFAYGLSLILLIAFTVLIGYNLGTNKNENRVTLVFKLKKPMAENVKLVGDFNNWNKSGINLEKTNGYWKTEIKLEEGSYRYFFIVDGQIVLDPSNPTINDPFGDKLSLVNVYQKRKENRL